jgi:hypothetical protein
MSYDRSLYKEDDDGWQPELRTDAGLVETCSIVYPDWYCELTGSATFDGLRARSLLVQARCAPTLFDVCGNGATRHSVVAKILGATVTLEDPSVPTLTTPSGPAWTATGWVSGTVQASIGASDNTGIKAIKAWVDGKIRGTTGRACDFTLRVPCTDEPGAAVSVDTTALADGAHRLEVGAVDAAENEARVARQADLLVDNHAPAAPQGLSVPSGTTRATNDFDVSWVLPPSDGGSPVVRSRYSLCRVSTWQCTAGSRSDDVTRLHLALPTVGRYVVRVWLEDAAAQTDPANAVSTTLDYEPPNADPGPAPPAGGSVSSPAPGGGGSEAALAPTVVPPTIAPTPPTARMDPKLRSIRARRTGRRVAVSGRVSALASGRIRLTYEQSIAGRIRRVAKTAPIRGGRFKVSLTLTKTLARARRGRLTVRYPGDADTRPATKKLTVRR